MVGDLLGGWTAVAGDGDAARECWADLIARWSQPHRHYHGLAHLTAVLAVIEAHADVAPDPDAVRLAAWFHDAVYDPRRADNEQRSADLTMAALDGLGIASAEVARLVLVTATHAYDVDDGNAALLCDADLAVLAAPPVAYVAYANTIRQEYAHVPDTDFRAGRAAVLEALLVQPALYGVPALAQRWEAPARANLAAELTLLRRR